VTLSVEWPDRSRLIPKASESVVATITGASVGTQTKLLARPPSGNTTTVTFTALNPGDVMLEAVAHPVADGTGVAQARGSVPVTVVAGQTTAVTVTMDSTIDRVEITPGNPSLAVGESAALTMTAYDAANAVVLCWPDNVTWVSATPGNVTVTSPGITSTAQAVASGSPVVTVTETESGKSATTTVTVRSVARGLADTPWPKAHGDILNSGLGLGGPRPVGTIGWSFDGGKGLTDPVIGVDGTVYVGGKTGLSAIDPVTGAQRWKYGASEVQSTAAVGANGLIYAGTVYGQVFAVRADTGALAWNEYGYGDVRAANLGDNGLVYFASSEGCVALDAETGEHRWTYSGYISQTSCPAIGPDGTVYVFISDVDGGAVALDGDTGAVKWRTPLATQSHTIVLDGKGSAYVLVNDGKLYCLDTATGGARWSSDVDASWTAPALGPDGTVYVAHSDNAGILGLTAFASFDGQVLWRVTLGRGACESQPAVSANGTVYVHARIFTGSFEYPHLFAVDVASKSVAWFKEFPYTASSALGTPAVAGGGTVYYRSVSGLTYAIR